MFIGALVFKVKILKKAKQLCSGNVAQKVPAVDYSCQWNPYSNS